MPELKPERVVSSRLKEPCKHFWDEVVDGKRQCVSCGAFKEVNGFVEESKDGE
jgi:hypothetical protein